MNFQNNFKGFNGVFNFFKTNFIVTFNKNVRLGSLKFKLCHYLLTLMSFQTCLTFFILWNIKRRYFEKCLFF